MVAKDHENAACGTAIHAMGCCQDIIFVNYGSSTEMLKLRLKRHQVGKLSLCGVLTANYVDEAGPFFKSCKNFSHYQQKT